MTYRDPSPPPADNKHIEAKGRLMYVVAMVIWVWMIIFNSIALNAWKRVADLEARTADLASCRVLDETESDERRRVTAEQDRALCDRFCDGASSATCTWRPEGVRACAYRVREPLDSARQRGHSRA